MHRICVGSTAKSSTRSLRCVSRLLASRRAHLRRSRSCLVSVVSPTQTCTQTGLQRTASFLRSSNDPLCEYCFSISPSVSSSCCVNLSNRTGPRRAPQHTTTPHIPVATGGGGGPPGAKGKRKKGPKRLHKQGATVEELDADMDAWRNGSGGGAATRSAA